MGEAWRTRLIYCVLLLQGDDGEIGPRGLPGESVSVQRVEGGAMGMPEEGYGHKRDTLSLAYYVISTPHLIAGTSRSP